MKQLATIDYNEMGPTLVVTIVYTDGSAEVRESPSDEWLNELQLQCKRQMKSYEAKKATTPKTLWQMTFGD